MDWIALHPDVTPDHLGFLPSFLSENDSDSAAEQINKNYQHGGGWRHFSGFTLNDRTMVLSYPEDPPMSPLAMTYLREEAVYFYESSWVLVLQKDGSFEVSRVD